MVSAAALAAALTIVIGCAPSDEDETSLPPHEPTDIAPLFTDDLADHSVELTDRGGLIDRTEGYERSPEGTHLALYLERLEEPSADTYVDGILTLTRVFADAFERWPELQSLDVCQERHRDDPRRNRQLIVTQIELTREVWAVIDWDTATLSDLVVALEEDEESFLRLSGDLADHPDIQRAQEALSEHVEQGG